MSNRDRQHGVDPLAIVDVGAIPDEEWPEARDKIAEALMSQVEALITGLKAQRADEGSEP